MIAGFSREIGLEGLVQYGVINKSHESADVYLKAYFARGRLLQHRVQIKTAIA